MDNTLQQPPLVVDLDHTLVETDLLVESILAFLSSRPLQALRLLGWLARGKAELKSKLAERLSTDVEGLPYRAECLDLIREAKADARMVVLATASHQRLADEVARHLGVFDEVYGTSGGENLKGIKKAQFLVDRFGDKGFDYVGDSWSDLPVWAKARKAITAGASKTLRETVSRKFENTHHMRSATKPPASAMAQYLRLIRPHQWAKNILLFLPIIAAHSFESGVWMQVMVAFVLFCVCASSTYILNDLFDLQSDRAHPRKKNRPLASGAVPLRHGMVLAPILALTGLTGALWALPLPFFLALSAYLITTIFYSVYLKKKLFLDVLTLAGLYTLRAIAGAAAASILISPWLLAFCMFLFLSLAMAKRLAELIVVADMDKTETLGRAYRTGDLPMLGAMGASSGFMSVLVLALYINSPAVIPLYASPMVLWGACPLLLLWVGRMLLISCRGEMHDDPLVFAMTDTASWMIGGAVLAVVLAGTWI
ncbi:MAG: UbiA family prenyltransferase [Alphaproteobacteria bacterium]|nr:UbiA family prenyltransferase [Alphaproteobacteria bacterium]